MKKILALLLATSGSLALAEGGNDGLYLGAGVGAGWNDMASPATAFRLDGGYNFNQYWALELGTTGITQSGGAVNENVH